MEAQGLTARPKRRYGNKVQWIVTLDTGRFGDWIIVETEAGATEQEIVKSLTRSQRRKVSSVKLVTRFNGPPEGHLF